MSEDFKLEIIYLDTGTATPPGGQQAGIPATSVRITHIPSGLMAQCGTGRRAQHKNREIAMEMIEWGLLAAGVYTL